MKISLSIPCGTIEEKKVYHREYGKLWREANAESLREYRRSRKSKNRELRQKRKSANPELFRLKSKENYQKNREKLLNFSKEARKNFPERKRRSHLKYVYGISEQQYTEMLLTQKGLCAICSCNSVGRKDRLHFYVDHNHESGKIRGLLCFRCNFGIGNFKDSMVLIKQAIGYLLSNKFYSFAGVKSTAGLKGRQYQLAYKFGMSTDDYDRILTEQNFGCAICCSTSTGRRDRNNFYVDHNHFNGFVRGLLCCACNAALGYFNDSVDTLQSAVNYLNVWSESC